LVPVLGRDAERLADAYELRAARPPAGLRLPRLRRSAVLTRALAAGALERAVELAAALEVRGYGAAPRSLRARTRSPWSLHDLSFALSAVAIVALAALGSAGVAAFDPYPALSSDLGPAGIGLALAVPGLTLLPFAAGTVRRARLARLDAAHPATGGGVG
jgi:energy-coupling factor transport system permease protein